MKKNENVIWQENKVSYEDRCRVLWQQGKVVWFTGLSGSGKSTIAVELEKMLNEAGKAVYLLDGDNIRCGINSDLGFSDEDRNENIRRIGEIAALFCDAGIITLVSFISPFREMRRVARERAGEGNFVEVYVNFILHFFRSEFKTFVYTIFSTLYMLLSTSSPGRKSLSIVQMLIPASPNSAASPSRALTLRTSSNHTVRGCPAASV